MTRMAQLMHTPLRAPSLQRGFSPSPLLGLCVLAGLSLGLSACEQRSGSDEPAQAKQKLTLKVASEFQSNMPVLGTTITQMASRLDIASDGMIKMKIYDPGELVPKLESLSAVSGGKVDMAFSAAGYWYGKLPAAPLFSSIPFGPEIGEYMAWMYEGNGMKLYQQMYDRKGFAVKVLICAILPPETSGWFAHPIKSQADLSGLKMRFYGLGGRVMEKLGVAVTLLSSAEIFQALEKGVIDATEYSMPSIDRKLGFYSIVKYNYFPGWHQQATLLELLINKKVWDEMSPSQKMLIELACRDGIVHSIAEGDGTQFAAMRKNVLDDGVTNMYWSPEMLELFRQTWEQVAVDECKKDRFFKQVYDDLAAFRNNYDIWKKNAFLPRDPRD